MKPARTALPRWAMLGWTLCLPLAWSGPCFDDKQLYNVVQRSATGRGALIYVWSPRMVYSVHNRLAAEHAAGAAGLDFIAVVDPASPEGGLQLCSAGLLAQEATRHFPTAFVVHAGRIHPHPMVGAMPERAWTLSIGLRIGTGSP